MSSFWTSFEKRAAEESRGGEAARGAMLVGGGALVAAGAVPRVTGRTTAYHGTSDARAQAILQKGVQPNHGGITDILPKETNAGGHSYFGNTPQQSAPYARGAEMFDSYAKEHGIPRAQAVAELTDGTARQVASRSPGTVLKASIPLWKHQHVPNPELYGASGPHTLKTHYERSTGRPLLGSPLAHWNEYNTPTVKGGVGPEVFKASPHYQKLGPREIMQYARARPGRFAGGVALGAAGLGVAGYGVHKAIQAARGQRKEAEVLADAEEQTKVPPLLERSLSQVGPRLDEFTVESDRSKYRGMGEM